MAKAGKEWSRKAGLSPGTLIHVGRKVATSTRIRVIDYTESNVEEIEVSRVEDCEPFKERPSVTWINVDGLHDVETIGKIGKLFELHPLLLEDTLNTEHRPKFEDFGAWVLIVLKMLYVDQEGGGIKAEQVSLVMGSGFVISFQEQEGDLFDAVRERIRMGKGRIRTMAEDYLCYALIDSIVDHYFIILEGISEKIENLEDELIAEPNTETLQVIYKLKRDMIMLRKSVWPHREIVNALLRGESRLVQEGTLIFLRDLYDHTIQVIDTIESLRDVISGLLDVYLSSLSNRMNEIMKTLTIMASIFIPLTFVAGIYGMNFEYMPELNLKFGYPMVLLAMGLITGSMLFYFKRRKWF